MWLLLQNLFDVSLGDDLEVNVSGIDDLVEDYLMGEPDDYYEEYRDWKADNLEIEYIFERETVIALYKEYDTIKKTCVR